MRHTLVSALLVLAGALPLGAAEPQPVQPPAAPWAELTIPDGARLVAHWATSPIGRAWADPGVEPLRTRITRELTTFSGVDPFAVLADSRQLRFALSAIDGSWAEAKMHFQVQADLGASVEPVFAALAKHGKPVDQPGRDAVVLLGDGATAVRVVRHDHWLLFAPAEDPIPESRSVSGAHDLNGTFDGPRAADWVMQANRLPAAGLSEAQFRSLMPPVAGQLDLGAVGGTSRITVGTAAPWLAPIAAGSFDRLTAQVLDLSAIGIDGQALWREAEPLVQHGLQERKQRGEPDPLVGLGVTATWQQLITGLGGTWSVVITPAMPVPGYSIIAPRSAALDELVGAIARKYDTALPAEGAVTTLMLQGFPFPLTIARTATNWLVSSDAMFASGWVATADGGWKDGALGRLASAKLAGDGCALMIGDTQAQIRAATPMVGMVFGAMPGVAFLPAEKQAAMTFMLRLAANATPGWTVVHHRGGGLVVDGEGLAAGSGSVPVVAVMAGMLLPAINMVREGARKANSANNMRQLVLACSVWANDNDEHWPPSVEKLREDTGGDLPDKVVHSPGDPTNQHAYLYVRPAKTALSTQPAFVEDPACWKGKGCTVAFCDGHVAWIPRDRAARVWSEAQRLAALPKAASKEQGIGPEDWAAVQQDLTPGEQGERVVPDAPAAPAAPAATTVP